MEYRSYLDHHSHHILFADRTEIPLENVSPEETWQSTCTHIADSTWSPAHAIRPSNINNIELICLDPQPHVDRPSFHAETCSLRICTAFLPNIYVSGSDGPSFLSVQSACCKWERIPRNSMKDVKRIPCRAYANILEGRLLHIFRTRISRGKRQVGLRINGTSQHRLYILGFVREL